MDNCKRVYISFLYAAVRSDCTKSRPKPIATCKKYGRPELAPTWEGRTHMASSELIANLSAHETKGTCVLQPRPRPASRSNRPDTYQRLPKSGTNLLAISSRSIHMGQLQPNTDGAGFRLLLGCGFNRSMQHTVRTFSAGVLSVRA